MRLCVMTFAVGVLSAVSPVIGQAPASQTTTLDLAVHWSKGDLFHLEVARTRTQTGRPDAEVRSRIDMEVLETGAEGHVVAWTIRKTEVLDANGQPVTVDEPAAKLLMEAFNNLPIEVELSSGFAVTGIRNIEKLHPAIRKSIDALVARSSKTEAEKRNLKATLEKLTLTDRFIVQAYAREIAVYLQMAGATLPLEGAREDESQQPMPIGGGLVAFKARVKIDSLDRERGLATVTGDQRPDPQAFAAALAKVFKETEAAGGVPAPADIPKIDAKDEFRYVIDLKTGLPNSAEFTRFLKAENTVGRDSTRITLKSFKPASRPAGRG